jgi:hypothetical protein
MSFVVVRKSPFLSRALVIILEARRVVIFKRWKGDSLFTWSKVWSLVSTVMDCSILLYNLTILAFRCLLPVVVEVFQDVVYASIVEVFIYCCFSCSLCLFLYE